MNLKVPWFRPAAWGVVVGSIATMFVGFTWSNDSTSRKRSSHVRGEVRYSELAATQFAPSLAGVGSLVGGVSHGHKVAMRGIER